MATIGSISLDLQDFALDGGSMFGVEPLTQIDEKIALLSRMLERGELLFFAHDPFSEAALLRRDEKGAIVADSFFTL